MKIGILTLPFHLNYGGIIQGYALQKTLNKLGYDVTILKVVVPHKERKFRLHCPVFIKKCLLHCHFNIRYIDEINKRTIYLRALKVTQKFIDTYMRVTPFEVSEKKTCCNAYDSIIVGSDQVWRPVFATPITEYYLEFIENDSYIKRIAYAASFGTAEWEYTEPQTFRCAQLAQKFDLITVREDSGVYLCQKYLGVKAMHVLDPTMLLDKEDYISIVEQENIQPLGGNLCSYMLDDNELKEDYVRQVALKLNLIPFSLTTTDKELYEEGKRYPGVPVWLRGFMDAKCVITDSFHGCVFSIIFNKPFIAIGNKERGQARFDSLLRMFHLQDRLVDISDLSMDCISQPIDWSTVNAIREQMKHRSISLLVENLK